MPSYPPPMLNDRQQMIADLLALEKSPEEVAEIVGVKVEYVRIMKKNHLFLTKVKDSRDKYLEGMRMAARERLVKMVDEAVGVVGDVMRVAEDDRLRFNAACKVIDQAELLEKKLKVTETREVKVSISPEKTKLVQAIIAEDDEGEVE